MMIRTDPGQEEHVRDRRLPLLQRQGRGADQEDLEGRRPQGLHTQPVRAGCLELSLLVQSWAHSWAIAEKFYFYHFLSIMFLQKQVVFAPRKAIFRAGHLWFCIENNLFN